MPGGEPAHGWPCWWSLQIEGAEAGEVLTLVLTASDRPVRNNGKLTDKPLAPEWAMPKRAAFSTDGKTWRSTEPGHREDTSMVYRVPAGKGTLHVAWGPPFTLQDVAALVATAEQRLPGVAKGFDLARTREGRPVPALRVAKGEAGVGRPVVWVQARQHAWESGGSWVGRGFLEWLTGEDAEAQELRATAEVLFVPIMDVDNVMTGNGGKEADPHDHNRGWTDAPIYPEVAAAQRHLQQFAAEGRLELFVDLHNPAPGDMRPFFFCAAPELLAPQAQARRTAFFASAQRYIVDPLPVEKTPRFTGPSYHPLWQQICDQWVTAHGNPQTVAVCLETAWNTPHSTTEGYRAVGAELGQAIAEFVRGNRQ